MSLRSRTTPASAVSLARLSAGFQRLADEERRRIARSLHDSAMQTLTAAAMNLSLLEQEAGGLSDQGRQALADAQAQIESCARELRELTHALFPALLGSAGLGPALRWLARQYGPARLRLEQESLPRYAVSVELAAYRLVEEATTGLFDDRVPVEARVAAQGGEVLEVTMEGHARRDGDALTKVALRQRVRGVGGRFRTRRRAGALRVEVRFPPMATDIPG
jgi:signal transduction histidine kinase